MESFRYTLLVLIILVMGTGFTSSSRILMIPMPGSKSHQSLFTSITEELLRRNHHVYIYGPECFPIFDRLEKLPAIFLKYRCDTDPEFAEKWEAMSHRYAQMSIESGGDMGPMFAKMQNLVGAICQDMLTDNRLLDQMKDLDIDLAVIDDQFMTRCAFLVPHRLGVPYISLVDVVEPWHLQLPWLPSAVPFKLLPFSEKMTFLERLTNTFTQIAFAWNPPFPNPPEDILEKYQMYGSFVSMEELSSRSMLYLLTTDYHLDYAVPLMPFIIPVPGLTLVPTKPLPVEFAKLLDNSKDGAVVVTFGSVISSIPELTSKKMIEAFRGTNKTVFWRYKNIYNLDIPPNVHISDWLPQNDLLAHPKVQLFVTHSGNSGQHEALYHGVPMIAFPIYGDHPYNSKRIVYKGFGVQMDIGTFSAEELLSNIKLVTSNSSFRSAIGKTSEMFKERPEPAWEKAAFWIEHVIEYGADHLHSYSEVMPWFQFLMLDIAVFCIIATSLFIFVMKKFGSFLWWLLCGKGKEKSE